jgi:hypothetical protein
MKYPCPCCGYLVFDEPPGSYEICPICFWEDDLAQLRFPRMSWGANRVSLIEAQENYFRNGVCELRFRANVRAAEASDVREPQWRRIDSGADRIEEPIPGKDYGCSYPEDATEFYYWRQGS